ncbi:MAG: NifU family protein [Beijerinckiaceae bacterium]|nr:NifU family protein [Beijerinckiaceae bacterium]
MFIQTEETPNPSTLKFLPGRTVMAEGTLDIRDAAGAERSPLAGRLFAIPGVTGVFYGADFVSVTKSEGEWQHLKPAILGAIMEHFMSGGPLIAADAVAEHEDGEFFAEEDAATVDTIKELLESRIRPAVASDGGDITFRGFKNGTVYLSMRGACAGCPSSTATLKSGIQNLLRHFLPDVQTVEAV